MAKAAKASHPSRERVNDAAAKDGVFSMANTSKPGRGDTPELGSEIRIPPKSRFRRRPDDGVDDTYRIHFVGSLDRGEMRRIIATLLEFLDESANVGIVGLTKVEFPGPDICEYRLWSADFRSDRLNKEFELLYRLNQIHAIDDVDGIRYSFLSRPSEVDKEL